MHKLETILRSRISSGLRRKSITSCSKWAEAYRVMGQPFPGPWRFEHHPWAREMHDCESEEIVGQKAAQMAFSEWALNKTFYNIDVRGFSVLYILPASNPDASQFSTSRFDPALELSPHLSTLFSEVKNIHHKRAGSANLFIRGSRSRSQLKSVPVSILVFDEVDEMVQENIPLAFERSSGQLEKQKLMISTPTIDNYGINMYYRRTTQEHFFFKCPSCSRMTELTFPECLVITAEDLTDQKLKDSYIICKECKATLKHEEKRIWLQSGIWVPSHTDRDNRGFHINQLYSMAMKPSGLAESYLKALTNPSDEQEFFNSKLGLTHAVQSAKITDEDIENCTKTYMKCLSAKKNSFITMGVDVGSWLHVEIDQWYFDEEIPTNDINILAKCKLLYECKVRNFEELDGFMREFNVNFCVIDANPERRKALEFANRFYGKVKLCFYANGVTSKNIHVHTDEECTISVDRTSWLDLSLSRFKNQKIILPQDVSLEYKTHIKAIVRVYDKDKDGNPVGKYVTGNEDDHFAHARNYSEMALPLGAGLVENYDISVVR